MRGRGFERGVVTGGRGWSEGEGLEVWHCWGRGWGLAVGAWLRLEGVV